MAIGCYDWVKNKESVLDQGWTLSYEAGFLRQKFKVKLWKVKTNKNKTHTKQSDIHGSDSTALMSAPVTVVFQYLYFYCCPCKRY